MKRSIAIFLLAACATVGADVFRQVGPDGEVSFSDTGTPDAERVNVTPAQAVPLRVVPGSPAGMEQPAGKSADGKKSRPSYAQFAIVAPTNGQSVRANSGDVTVTLALQPGLVQGHSIELVVDGEGGQQLFSGTGLSFQLSELSRGEYTLLARVKNGRGERLNETGPVSFYVLRVGLGG